MDASALPKDGFQCESESKETPTIITFEDKSEEREDYSNVTDENFLIAFHGGNFPFFLQASNIASQSDLDDNQASLYTINMGVQNSAKKIIPESEETLKEPIFEDENSLQGRNLELSSLMSSSPSRMEDFMDIVTTYKCKFCPFSCDGKTALMSHIHSSHFNELPVMHSSAASSIDSGDSQDFNLEMTVETSSGTCFNRVSPAFESGTDLQTEGQDLDHVQGLFEEASNSKPEFTCNEENLEKVKLKKDEIRTDKCLLESRMIQAGEMTQSNEEHIFLCGKCSIGFTSLELCKKHMIEHHIISMGSSSSTGKCTRKRGRPRLLKHLVSSPPVQCLENIGNPNVKLEEEEEEEGEEEENKRNPMLQATQLTRRQGKRDCMVDRTFKCSERGCNYRFKSEKSLKYHKCCHIGDSVSEDKGFICPECMKKVYYWRILIMHLWKEHEIDLDLHSCTECQYKSYSIFKLENHKRIHSETREFICEKCNKGFKQLSQLRNHQVMHLDRKNMSEKRWYSVQQCDICQRSFSDSKCLRKHQQAVHRKIRPYICTYCGHLSARKAMLDLHVRQHTGEKPFFCEHCNYRTGDHNSLRRHRMRHTGDKPYQCVHCNYSCIQAISFKTHMKNKHPGQEGLYACRLCRFRSVSKENYLHHMADHKRGDLPILNEPIPAQIEDRDDPPPDENAEQSIPQLHLPENTLQQLEGILPDNILAAQLIYNCLNALTKEGGNLPPGVTASSSGDGTQTITIKLPSELQQTQPDQYFFTVQDNEVILPHGATVISNESKLPLPSNSAQLMSLIENNDDEIKEELDTSSFITNITMDVSGTCGPLILSENNGS